MSARLGLKLASAAEYIIVFSNSEWVYSTLTIMPDPDSEEPRMYLCIARKTETGWHAYIEGEKGFVEAVVAAPTTVVPPYVKDSLRPPVRSIEGDTSAQLSLPWSVGEEAVLWGGPHSWDGNTTERQSLDFKPSTTHVLAARGGVVYVSCLGYYVRVDHGDNWKTSYYHMNNVSLQSGTSVDRYGYLGDISQNVGGTCGGSANSGPHVHFTLHYKVGSGENPVSIVGHELSGWTVVAGANNYEGCLTKGGVSKCRGESIPNDESSSGACSSWVYDFSFNPPSPSNATNVSVHASFGTGFPNYRAARVRVVGGSQICENSSFDFNCNWNTLSTSDGDHSLILEIDDNVGSSWDSPQTCTEPYHLNARAAPPTNTPTPPSAATNTPTPSSSCSNATSPGPNQVFVYAGAGFAGNCKPLSVGNYPNSGYFSPVGDNDIEALKVGGNVRAILYADTNYNGTSSMIESDDAELNDNPIGRNSTSSIIVELKPPPPPTNTPTPTALPRPGNDDFANAYWVSGSAGSTAGSNVGATFENGEPYHFGRTTALTSVWFRWIPPYSSLVTIDTSGSPFDTVMGVYLGSTLAALAQVAADDDAGPNNTSRVTFDAIAGATYNIAIAGYSSQIGNYALNWLMSAPPTATPTWTPIPATATPTQTPTPAPATCPTITDWKAEYWNNMNWAGARALCRNEAAIDVDWMAESPDPAIQADQFSAQWTRSLVFPAGTYRFSMVHDDGNQLYIDGVKVFENACTNCRETDTVTIPLTGAPHQIVYRVFENSGWAAAGLSWQMEATATPTPSPTLIWTRTPIPRRIGAGTFHTCLVSAPGAAACWGSNDDGQLGNNSTIDSLAPGGVVGMGSGVAAITAGDYHTCGLTIFGGVKCWGYNGHGQLGNNSTVSSLVPVDVSGLGGGVISISAGSAHNCALSNTGGVTCWGSNNYGQLGNNSTTNTQVPVQVFGLDSGAIAIASGMFHTCALIGAGGVKCWGRNMQGQLGNDSTSNSSTPVFVVGLGSEISAIATGSSHTCGLTNGGGVKCWGDNSHGALGNDNTAAAYTPVDVVGLGGSARAIAAGGSHTCALVDAGGVKCWGFNGQGQLGNNTWLGAKVPVDVVGLGMGASEIDLGVAHSCIIANGGGVKCWGWNAYGQLGNNSLESSSIPVDVVSLPGRAYLPLTIRTIPGSWTILFTENFEGDFPASRWRILDSNNLGYFWGGTTCRSFSGSRSAWAAGGFSGVPALACNALYPSGMRTWMIAGPFSLADATAATLRFKLWRNSEVGHDYILWGVSSDNDWFNGAGSWGSSAGWEAVTLDLSSANDQNYLGLPNVWIGFLFDADVTGTLEGGAFVDEIELRKCVGGVCSATQMPTNVKDQVTRSFRVKQ